MLVIHIIDLKHKYGCNAMMKINIRQTDKHNVASPCKSFFGRSHRSVTVAQAAQIEMVDAAGIAQKSGYELMVRHAGGRDNLGFIHKDYKNYQQSKRSMDMEGDACHILEYLQKMQSDDPNFFSAIQLDNLDQITNIFVS